MIYDVAIIGNGIVGSLLAHQLNQKNLKHALLVKKKD